MSVQLDPIIAEKLEDFAPTAQLIILRGICTAIVTLLASFQPLPLPTISPSPHARRVADHLSYAGYAVVVLAVWRLAPGFVGVAQSQKTRPLDRANRSSGKIFSLPSNLVEEKAWKAIRKSFASSCKRTFLPESER